MKRDLGTTRAPWHRAASMLITGLVTRAIGPHTDSRTVQQTLTDWVAPAATTNHTDKRY